MEEPDRERGTPFCEPMRRGVLLVGVPQPAAGFEQPRMAFLQRPSEVSYYASHFWVDAPSRMLAPLLIRSLEQWEPGVWSSPCPRPSVPTINWMCRGGGPTGVRTAAEPQSGAVASATDRREDAAWWGPEVSTGWNRLPVRMHMEGVGGEPRGERGAG